MSKKNILIVSGSTLLASFVAVFLVWFSYTLLSIEIRVSEILAAAIIPITTAPLIMLYGIKQNLKIADLEKDVEIRDTSLLVYQHSVAASNHIHNNLMNNFQLFILKYQNNQEVDQTLIAKLQKSIDQAIKQMEVLNNIDLPHESESYNEIYPK